MSKQNKKLQMTTIFVCIKSGGFSLAACGLQAMARRGEAERLAGRRCAIKMPRTFTAFPKQWATPCDLPLALYITL